MKKSDQSGERQKTVRISRAKKRGDTRAIARSRDVSRAIPWRRIARGLGVVLFCLLIGASLGVAAKAGWTWLSSSPRFAVRQMVIRTGPKVTEREVRMLAGVKEGDNIFRFRLADCVASLEIHPWVKRASVMRELPDRVVIDIVERKAAAVIALGSLYYVDTDGEVFKKVLPGENLDLPVLSGLTLRQVVERSPEADALIREGLDLSGLASRSAILPAEEVSEIRLDHTWGAIIIRAGDGMRIRFGSGNFPDKWMRMEQTLAELGADVAKVAELDLNYESKVTVRLRDGYRLASASAEPPEQE